MQEACGFLERNRGTTIRKLIEDAATLCQDCEGYVPRTQDA